MLYRKVFFPNKQKTLGDAHSREVEDVAMQPRSVQMCAKAHIISQSIISIATKENM